ncbi:hypothetical protein [uncultured Gordonia sp.]|uniref:hypothetical protein n=1 Tax=uncultured Gordonia sp. TaxID=198437 RepID=UPI0026133FE8|nr:hypothetical protein [uncultured Gordonia sp.]
MAEDMTPEQRERAERQRAADGVQRRRQAMNEEQAAQASGAQGKGLDHDRVAQIRSELAAGGDRAVEKKFGKSGANSAEAAKARTQRANVRKHENQMRQAAHAERSGDADQKQQAQKVRLSPQEARERLQSGQDAVKAANKVAAQRGKVQSVGLGM